MLPPMRNCSPGSSRPRWPSNAPRSIHHPTPVTLRCARASATGKGASRRAMGASLSRAIAESRYLLRERGSRWHPSHRWARGPDHPQGWQASDSRVPGHPGTPHGALLPAARKPPVHRTATSCWSSARLGTPAVRPEQVARLTRAYYHEDPEADRRDEWAR